MHHAKLGIGEENGVMKIRAERVGAKIQWSFTRSHRPDLGFLVPPSRLERETSGSTIQRSNQLS
jgi:hypothetical protein